MLSIFTSPMHHHEDSLFYKDCSLCVFGMHNTSSILQDIFDFTLYPFATELTFTANDYCISFDDLAPFLSRAPPA